MKTQFLSTPVAVKPSLPPETPFQLAKQEWDHRIGTNVAQARNWRAAFFVNALFSIVLIASLLIQMLQAKVVQVLVGIDKERGEPTVIGPADAKKYQPGPLEIKYFLTQFIRFVRAVPTDQVVIKQNWLRAYTFLRKDAAGLLNELTSKDADSALKKSGHSIVSVQPISVVQIPDTQSYQMHLKETDY